QLLLLLGDSVLALVELRPFADELLRVGAGARAGARCVAAAGQGRGQVLLAAGALGGGGGAVRAPGPVLEGGRQEGGRAGRQTEEDDAHDTENDDGAHPRTSPVTMVPASRLARLATGASPPRQAALAASEALASGAPAIPRGAGAGAPRPPWQSACGRHW